MKKLIFALALALTAALQAGTWTDESTGITWSYSITTEIVTNVVEEETEQVVTNTYAAVERRPGWNWTSFTRDNWTVSIPATFEDAQVV